MKYGDEELNNKVFFIDQDANIYNDKNEFIGKIGVDGYMVNYNNNSLYKYNQFLGFIGDLHDRENNISNVDNSNDNIKIKVKEKGVAFISFSVILFILGILLVIILVLGAFTILQ